MPRAEVVRAGWYWQGARVGVGQVVEASEQQIAAWGEHVRPLDEVPAVEVADAPALEAEAEVADAPERRAPKRRRG
jgi:hypothetical protein